MMNKPIIYLILITILFTGCKSQKEKAFSISSPTLLHFKDIPSASGITSYDNKIFIVGDDCPYLFTLDSSLSITNKIKISAIDSTINGRTPKSIKADFESTELFTLNDTVKLLILSSGSSITTRDTAHIVSILPKGEIISKNIRPLFDKIKISAKMPISDEINIEAVTFSNNNAYIFHRGNINGNIIVEINKDKFLNYIKNDVAVPEFIIYNFKLPNYNNVTSGFSGACTTPDGTGIIFTASMEATDNEVNDGEIIGSFVGLINLSEIKKGNYTATLLQNDAGVLLAHKLEGITVITDRNSNKLKVITVCDNDNGTSEIIKFNMIFNSKKNSEKLSSQNNYHN